MFDMEMRKYLKFIFGEFILVVFGILIALQLNNWNEERIEQRQITEYAHALVEDLERDIVMANTMTVEINLLLEKIDALAAYIQDKSIDQMRNIDLFYLMREPFYRPYSWNRTALEQIRSSGALRQMKDPVLVEQISAYEASTRHLEADFDFDRTLGTDAAALANLVVDMNYPNVYEIYPVEEMEYFSFPDSELHDAFTNTILSLLTDDINEIRKAVNVYVTLGGRFGIRPRVEIEMPRLMESARELIELLNSEYPE